MNTVNKSTESETFLSALQRQAAQGVPVGLIPELEKPLVPSKPSPSALRIQPVTNDTPNNNNQNHRQSGQHSGTYQQNPDGSIEIVTNEPSILDTVA